MRFYPAFCIAVLSFSLLISLGNISNAWAHSTFATKTLSWVQTLKSLRSDRPAYKSGTAITAVFGVDTQPVSSLLPSVPDVVGHPGGQVYWYTYAIGPNGQPIFDGVPVIKISGGGQIGPAQSISGVFPFSEPYAFFAPFNPLKPGKYILSAHFAHESVSTYYYLYKIIVLSCDPSIPGAKGFAFTGGMWRVVKAAAADIGISCGKAPRLLFPHGAAKPTAPVLDALGDPNSAFSLVTSPQPFAVNETSLPLSLAAGSVVNVLLASGGFAKFMLEINPFQGAPIAIGLLQATDSSGTYPF